MRQVGEASLLLFLGFVKDNRLSDIAKRRIESVRQQMNCQRLAIARHNQGLTLVREQIPGAFGNPFRVHTRGIAESFETRNAALKNLLPAARPRSATPRSPAREGDDPH